MTKIEKARAEATEDVIATLANRASCHTTGLAVVPLRSTPYMLNKALKQMQLEGLIFVHRLATARRCAIIDLVNA